MNAAANNVNERNVDPTLMNDIKPKAIANLVKMLNEEDTTRLLRLIEETGSLIAGGFLLHSLHGETEPNHYVAPHFRFEYGKRVNRPDIDIYVPMENAATFMQQLIYGSPTVEPILDGYDAKLGSFKSTMYCQSFLRKNGIQMIHNIYIEGEEDHRHYENSYEIDIMIVRSWRTPIQVVNNFDLSFCQVWFNGVNVHASHPEDVRNKKGILQGEYVNLFLQGNEFLQNRLQKYRTRGYQIRLDRERLEEIGDNVLTNMPICAEESKEAIMKHWTSRVILYWLLGVRDVITSHTNPLTPSITHNDILIVPLKMHIRNTTQPNVGDNFIQAHGQRAYHNREYPESINGYDSEDYENDESLYKIIGKYYGQEWNDARSKLEYFRDTNKLIELIMWSNTYEFGRGGWSEYYASMGFIFDYAGEDNRKVYYKPFYDALRARCIRKSKYTAITNPEPNNNNDDDDSDDEEEVFDFHQHPLNAGISAADLEGYLSSSYMDVPDKNAVPCYHRPNPGQPDHEDNCQRPITLSQVKYIVNKEFYDKYSKPAPQKLGLDQFIDFFDQLLGNEKEVNSLGFGEIYHHTLCPFCLQFESRDSGCAYMTHDSKSGMPDEPHCKEELQIKEIIDRYRASAQVLINAEYGGRGPPAHMEFCAECGRPCANHKHLTTDGSAFEVAPQLGGHDDYGKCAGLGRAELFARVLAIRQVYRESNGLSRIEERRRAALAAESAPTNPALMAKGREILAMAPDNRRWGNAELPREKRYNNAINEEDNEEDDDDEKDEADEKEEPAVPAAAPPPAVEARRRRQIIQRHDAIMARIEDLEGRIRDRDAMRAIGRLDREIGVIGDPAAFAQRVDLDHLEAELNRVEEELDDYEDEANENEGVEVEEPAAAAAANPVNEERRTQMRERYHRLGNQVDDMEDEEKDNLFEFIIELLHECDIIDDPHFGEVHNMDIYDRKLDRIEEMITNLPRRRQIRERYNRLLREVDAMMNEEMIEVIEPIRSDLEELALIQGPELGEALDLNYYDERLDRIEEMIHDLEDQQPENGIFGGGRFKRSRKKHPRRQQKTLRNLLKKLK
uniref:Uncharacterized protein n=1 Tax=viral metagenome TaxID=1070528 RepID=A0A6C0KRV0_9ZZZZ